MLTGSSVNANGLHVPQYMELLNKHFVYWYPDNGFGWCGNSQKARDIVDQAVLRGKKLRGNCLLSCTTHGLRNEYLLSLSEKDIYQHIEGVLTNFPEITVWDCTHEALTDNGGYRNTVWVEKLGKNWQEKIFKFARETAPQTELYYCDYFRNQSKFARSYQMISYWLDKGVPVKGISVQLHANLKPSFTNRYSTLSLELVEYWLRKFKEMGLSIHCPEIVVWQPCPSPDIEKMRGKADIRKEYARAAIGRLLIEFSDVNNIQGIVYQQIIDICEKVGVDMIGFWSAFDLFPWNWIGNRCKAGIWDKDFNPKSESLVQRISKLSKT